MRDELQIESTNCVNSNHKARFLAKDDEDCCQCSFGECKVKVLISYNGHEPYRYILTEKEIEDANKTIANHNQSAS